MADPVSVISSLPSLCKLAWEVYKLCKDASESFNNVTQEVLSLHAVLREAEESLAQTSLSDSKLAGLTTVVNGCRDVLTDLNELVQKYKKLDSKTQRVWHRVGWHMEDIAELRLRLVSNVGFLTAFMSTSQLSVERKLDQLLQEFKSGQHEGSIITTQTVESISIDEKQTWRAIRKELEDFGISIEAFESNKTFIMTWFREALERGDFQDQQEDDSSEDDYEASLKSDHESKDGEMGVTYEDVQNNLLQIAERTTVRKEVLTARQHTGGAASSKGFATGTSTTANSIPTLSRRNIFGNLAKLFVNHNKELWEACTNGRHEDVQNLLLKGANVNAYYDRKTCLYVAVEGGHFRVVEALIHHGADLNIHCKVLGRRKQVFRTYTALSLSARLSKMEIMQLLVKSGAAIDFPGNRNSYNPLAWASVRQDLSAMKYLLSQGANVNGPGSSRGRVPIVVAARHGKNPAVKLLIESGADPQRTSPREKTALWGACNRMEFNYHQTPIVDFKITGHELIRMLLEAGADPDTEVFWSVPIPKMAPEIRNLLQKYSGMNPTPVSHP